MQAAYFPCLLLAPAPSSPLRQAVIHCEIVRQSARVVAMDRERLRCVLAAIPPLCHSFLCSGWSVCRMLHPAWRPLGAIVLCNALRPTNHAYACAAWHPPVLSCCPVHSQFG